MALQNSDECTIGVSQHTSLPSGSLNCLSESPICRTISPRFGAGIYYKQQYE